MQNSALYHVYRNGDSEHFFSVEFFGEGCLFGKLVIEDGDGYLPEIQSDDGRFTAVLQEPPDQEPPDQFRTDAEADADALASAGMGTDEDYTGGAESIDSFDDE